MMKWISGIVVLGVVALIIEAFTPWGSLARSSGMEQSIQAALDEAGFKGVEVEMSGNVAKLVGDVPSEELKSAAIATATNTECSNCRAGHIWHEVNGSELNLVKLVPTVRPYTFTGELAETGAVVLSGHATSEQERGRIVAHAQGLFPAGVDDNEVKIALGSPGDDWALVTQKHLDALSAMQSGKFSITDTNSFLSGRTDSVEARQKINGVISNLPGTFSGAANITVPNAEADNIGAISSEAVCQELFENLKGETKISFAYNRAEINDESSLNLIKSLAAAANQCSSFHIDVGGHTDADGSDAYNLDLSGLRAQEVVKYLVDYGVNADNITGSGYGETRPIASNDTPEGMARNRRIEFKVTRSK